MKEKIGQHFKGKKYVKELVDIKIYYEVSIIESSSTQKENKLLNLNKKPRSRPKIWKFCISYRWNPKAFAQKNIYIK